MNENQIRAMISLLDDTDEEVITHIEQQIMSFGQTIVPLLLSEAERNPLISNRVQSLVHQLHHEDLNVRLKLWAKMGGNDLLEGLWLVALYAYSDLKLETLRYEIEQIYYEAWLDFRYELSPTEQVKTLNNVIFNKLRFRAADAATFHSPANSMINRILESHRSNPIGLCVIYMLIAQKLRLPIFGVNLPNLFVLTYKKDDLQFYINVFQKGLVFSRADIDNFLQQSNMTPQAAYYEPCSHTDIVRRVLRNLIVAYEKMSENQKANDVRQLLYSLGE